MSLEQLSTLAGIAATVLGGLFALIRWHVQSMQAFAKKEDLAELERRVNEKVNTLDKHVETMTAMWVAKGPS